MKLTKTKLGDVILILASQASKYIHGCAVYSSTVKVARSGSRAIPSYPCPLSCLYIHWSMSVVIRI